MLSRLELGGLATVFGGSGFLGSQVVRALARDGWRVRAAVRRPDLAGRLQPMGNVGQVHAIQANVRFPQSVVRAVEGAEAVVNAVGILAPSGAQTFRAVHVEGARAIARAAREAGAKQLIHISAIGANRKGSANYARTKAAGEQAVLEEFPGAIILRPSIVFGPEDDFFNRFASMARTSPILPLVGGRTKFQPVYVGDVAAAVAAACEGKGAAGAIYELGGPEVFTFRQLLDRTQAWAGRKCAYLPIPFWAASLMALATWPMPNTVRPLTLDQVRLLRADNVVSEGARKERRSLDALGVDAPQTIAAIVPGYLEQYRPRGQFSRYRG